MDRVRQMQIFIQVMESGNFTRAAETLGIPRSTVSTEIQALEDRLKTQLLHRTTRKVSLTQDGRRFEETARDIIDAVAASERMFRQTDVDVTGRLRVDVPSRIGRKILLPALPGLLERHPGLTIDLSSSDRFVDLIADGVDCALRAGVLTDAEIVARKLCELDLVTCASPGYLAARGSPESLEALSGHVSVNYATRLPAPASTLEFVVEGTLREVAIKSAVTVDGAEAYIAAACAGLGLIQVPSYDVRDPIRARRLVSALPQFPPPPMPLSFLFSKRRNLSPRVRLFGSWLESVLEAEGIDVGAPTLP